MSVSTTRIPKALCSLINAAALVCRAADDLCNTPVTTARLTWRHVCEINETGRGIALAGYLVPLSAPSWIAGVLVDMSCKGAMLPYRHACAAVGVWGIAVLGSVMLGYLNGEMAGLFPLTTDLKKNPLLGPRAPKRNLGLEDIGIRR